MKKEEIEKAERKKRFEEKKMEKKRKRRQKQRERRNDGNSTTETNVDLLLGISSTTERTSTSSSVAGVEKMKRQQTGKYDERTENEKKKEKKREKNWRKKERKREIKKRKTEEKNKDKNEEENEKKNEEKNKEKNEKKNEDHRYCDMDVEKKRKNRRKQKERLLSMRKKRKEERMKLWLDRTRMELVRRSGRRAEDSRQYKKKEYEEYIKMNIKAGNERGLKLKWGCFKGWEVYAGKNFKEGDFICEYKGNLLKRKKAMELEEMYNKNPETYGSFVMFFKHKDITFAVDATIEDKSKGRLINHSKLKCNVENKVMEIDGTPRVYFVAKKTIFFNTELLYDYGERVEAILEDNPFLRS